MTNTRSPGPNRRTVVAGLTASLALAGHVPAGVAAARDPRFVTIILRGALDGLAVVAPVGDPDYGALRGDLAISASGELAGLPLTDFFALNPALPFLHSLYRKREALILHAVASPYRGRSHFDGQDVLETGLGGVGRSDDGWLNRSVAAIQTRANANPHGLALDAVVPLVIRGAAPVMSWIPKATKRSLHVSTADRLADLYAATDPGLAKALAQGLEIEKMSGGSGAEPSAVKGRFREIIMAMSAAARLLKSPGGPRVGALSINGWDTHANQGVVKGQLFGALGGFDGALKVLVDDLGPAAWKDTVIFVVTEFGRTARVNGTSGTDHGTGTVALVLGGQINGGQVVADWPGLRAGQLFEQRDLKPTLDVRAVAKGLLAAQFGLSERALGEKVFPDSRAIRPLGGLIA